MNLFWRDSLFELLAGHSALETTGTLWVLGARKVPYAILLNAGTSVWAAPQLPSPQYLVALAIQYQWILRLKPDIVSALMRYARTPEASISFVFQAFAAFTSPQLVSAFLFSLTRDSLLALPPQVTFFSFEPALPDGIVRSDCFMTCCPQSTDALLASLLDSETELLLCPKMPDRSVPTGAIARRES